MIELRWRLPIFGTLLLIMASPFARGKEPSPENVDVLIKGGTVYDGTGKKPRVTDVAIRGDRIAELGSFAADKARVVIDAKGLAVAPGFINMLSWSTESLIEDGLSQSEIRQGVTTEIMGEGFSMGPVNDRMKARMVSEQRDIKYEIKWNTLAEYLTFLEQHGIAPNVASYLGATTVREYVIGLEDKAPTPQQPHPRCKWKTAGTIFPVPCQSAWSVAARTGWPIACARPSPPAPMATAGACPPNGKLLRRWRSPAARCARL